MLGRRVVQGCCARVARTHAAEPNDARGQLHSGAMSAIFLRQAPEPLDTPL